MFKRLWARVALAFSPFLPTSQAPATSLDSHTTPTVIRNDKYDEMEVESVVFASHTQDLDARYTGERMGIDSQLEALMRARGKGLRFVNSALNSAAVCAERESFIAARMRDL